MFNLFRLLFLGWNSCRFSLVLFSPLAILQVSNSHIFLSCRFLSFSFCTRNNIWFTLVLSSKSFLTHCPLSHYFVLFPSSWKVKALYKVKTFVWIIHPNKINNDDLLQACKPHKVVSRYHFVRLELFQI